ncbi:MAG: cupin domain-containing protein [Thermoanaerobaculia bacterium]|nr:cupin domain-containing protein [Thermoanaerobaculia bacterium]
MHPDNLLTDRLPPPEAKDEQVLELLRRGPVRAERIVSTGQASAPGFWYDQDEVEWVLLLAGAAGLRFEDEDRVRELRPGDHVLIEAHRRHRVEWTAQSEPTIWLALFYAPG